MAKPRQQAAGEGMGRIRAAVVEAPAELTPALLEAVDLHLHRELRQARQGGQIVVEPGEQPIALGVPKGETHRIEPLEHQGFGLLRSETDVSGEDRLGHGAIIPIKPTGMVCFEPQRSHIHPLPGRACDHRLYTHAAPPRCPVSLSRPSALSERLRALLQERTTLIRLRGLLLFGLGWLLSPMCWWNDLLINLPLAWGFARLLQLWRPDWFAPGLVIGYWLSNVIGILLMQSGAVAALKRDPAETDPRRELLTGLLTSTAYTLVVVLLVKHGLIASPLEALS